MIEVRSAGLQCTVQDLGRPGQQAHGVAPGGALDRFSHILANRLVGNSPDAATLEITLAGPTLYFSRPAVVALCGACFQAEVNGEPLPDWRPVRLPAGSQLRIGGAREGCRGYLAVSGGLEVPRVLGSRATDVRGGFGGCWGRPLRAGDRLRFGRIEPGVDRVEASAWWIDVETELALSRPAVAGVLPAAAGEAPRDRLVAGRWSVANDSSRQGLRLTGPRIELPERWTRPSEPVLPGTVQLPPDGQPIVLLGEAQTVGGYPRIGHVAAADLPRLAQLRPGESLAFVAIERADALRRMALQQQRLARIELAIAHRLSGQAIHG